MRIIYLFGIALCLSLTGCSRADFMKRFVPQEDEAAARQYVELLRQGKFDQIEQNLEPALVDPQERNTLATMAAMIPAGDPESVKVVGLQVTRGKDFSTTNLTLEYQFSNKWLLANVATRKSDGNTTLTGFHVGPIPDSLENTNRFSLLGRGISQYLILTLAVCSLLFSVYAFVLCARTKGLKAKWLWLLVTVLGVGQLLVNWTTGQWSFNLLAVNIPCGRAFASGYEPWMVVAALPLGALIFLNHRRKMKVAGTLLEPPIQLQS